MLLVEHESVVAGFKVGQIHTPSAANDDMECIHCLYRAAYRLVFSVHDTVSRRIRLRRRHEQSRSPL
jgi:hypothetical protein